jgi:small subunit ribosomal protein S1
MFGKVTNIADYGAFVELEPGIEGLVHVSEMDWTNKNVAPSKIVSLGDEVEVMVLEIDEDKRRISLGMKQCKANPWQEFAQNTKRGDRVKGPIKSITDFGVFVGLAAGIDGLVHLSDLSWNEPAKPPCATTRRARKSKRSCWPSTSTASASAWASSSWTATRSPPSPRCTTRAPRDGQGSRPVDPKGAEIDLGPGHHRLPCRRLVDRPATRVEDARNVLKEGDEITAVGDPNIDRKTRNIQLFDPQKDMADEQGAMAQAVAAVLARAGRHDQPGARCACQAERQDSS